MSNLSAYPFPIPFMQSARGVKPRDDFNSVPIPIGLLQMPVRLASWLLYKAASAQQVFEWTPLSDGPGTRVDYTGAPGWDGTKFKVLGDPIELLDAADFAEYFSRGAYDTPQAARDGVRGYDVFTTENPYGPNWSFDRIPGDWMIFPWGEGLNNIDKMMRREAVANWPTIKETARENASGAMQAWGDRLADWLAEENARVPKNELLIEDIQRQISVKEALVPQVQKRIDADFVIADAFRQQMIDLGGSQAEADRFGTQYVCSLIEQYNLWIAGEEILEAFSVTNMPLNLFHRSFWQWVYLLLEGKWFGWDRFFGLIPEICFLGAGYTTEALSALSSNAIPALSAAQIGVTISQPVPKPQLIVSEYGFNRSFATYFTTPPPSITRTAIAPISLGFSAEACAVLPESTIPPYAWNIVTNDLSSQQVSAIPGVEVGVFRIEDASALSSEQLAALSTGDVPALTLYECPLFATAGRVGGLSITWRILTTRP